MTSLLVALARTTLGALLMFPAMLCFGADATEPGGTSEATQLALTNPDEYAWRLFLYMNSPAKPGVAGVPDPVRKFGDTSGSVVWESWALSSGRDLSETYPKNGADPVPWDKLNRAGRQLILSLNLEQAAVNQRLERKSGKPPTLFVPQFPESQEVRANRSMYEFIGTKGMYSRDGLESLFQQAVQTKNRQLISFPSNAKEIKAEWRPISETQKPRYLWRETTDSSGKKQAYGLVSLHIITKDLPNWLWADFGHIDCEDRKGACNIDGQEPALTRPIDRTTNGPGAPAGSNGRRNETVGTVFENYILRGTQIDFTTPFGDPTILSNPVIENKFQQSSCLSCHARASVGPRLLDPNGKPIPGLNMLDPGDPTLGPPNPALFGAGSGSVEDEIKFLQTDFVWSAPFRAQRKP